MICKKRIAWTMWENGSDLGPVSRKSRKLFGPENKYLNRSIKNESAGPGQQTTPFRFIK